MSIKTLKKTGYATAATLMVCNLQSCSKYDDGPAISLRTKKARVVGDWDVVRIGNEVFPQSGYALEMEFEKDGDFKFTYSYLSYSYSYAGSWSFSSDKEDLELILGGTVQTFEIKRLKHKELWMEDNSNNEEWRLEAQ